MDPCDILTRVDLNFFILNKISEISCVHCSLSSTLENSCVYSSVPSYAVTIAILKYASFHSLCCLMKKKVKSFKQTDWQCGLVVGLDQRSCATSDPVSTMMGDRLWMG